MILIDLNQIMIANLMVQIGNHKNSLLDESMIRHMVLNSIRYNRKKFKDIYGELVICCDDTNLWRKSSFPYYKANRKKAREESELDWNLIFTSLNRIRDELKETFPYKVLQLRTAEADDVIGVIVHSLGTPLNSGEPILILSGDKDYIQLHKYGNVTQYDPVGKRFVTHSDPEFYLREHIIKGDKGDGVPNVLSPDNSLVLNTRQKTLTQGRMADLLAFKNMTTEVERNYARNKMMIDLSQIPKDLSAQILDEFHKEINKPRGKLMDYFIKHRLSQLLESIGDF